MIETRNKIYSEQTVMTLILCEKNYDKFLMMLYQIHSASSNTADLLADPKYGDSNLFLS